MVRALRGPDGPMLLMTLINDAGRAAEYFGVRPLNPAFLSGLSPPVALRAAD
jgi:hypothetical protein